ncbi:MAG: hypothetical protein GEU75_15685 [Dehalococcoidia bacterium]|nr:hypothetical protein [Dehalococcoidia bacterium]
MKLTESEGDVENSYEYDVFGAVRSSTGSEPNVFKFTGEQVDSSTGLEYLRARYYDQATGRFISRDPLTSSPGWRGSPFAYVGSNATNMTDPLGLCGWKDPWNCGDDLARSAASKVINTYTVTSAVQAVATVGIGTGCIGDDSIANSVGVRSSFHA